MNPNANAGQSFHDYMLLCSILARPDLRWEDTREPEDSRGSFGEVPERYVSVELAGSDPWTTRYPATGRLTRDSILCSKCSRHTTGGMASGWACVTHVVP